MVLFYFFFFKQKTAYEMSIGDWSSDVCSSDLHRGHNLVGSFLVLYFDVRVFVLDELGFKKRWLAPIQHRVNGPILLRHKRADGYLALDDQAQRHSLHAAS